MTKCIVIGSSIRASATADILSTSDVPTISIPHNRGHSVVADACAREKALKVIALYCADFPTDGGITLCTILRRRIDKNVSLHALVETDENEETIALLKESGVQEVSFAPAPMVPFKAAMFVKQCWFKNTALPIAATRARIVRPLDKVTAPLVATKELTEVSTRSVSPPQAPKRSIDSHVPVKEQTAVVGLRAFNELMNSLRLNTKLTSAPCVVDILGKHGTVIELDPRRVKPLPENPRSKNSPGFTSENLRELADSIKTLGQVEEILVCPLAGDKHFDAQLIDGERRLQAAKLANVMVRATVREDITQDMAKQRYLISIVRNIQKEEHTTREYMRMVQVLRSPEYDMTQDETAAILKKSKNFVIQHEILARLHPDVQVMLDGGSDRAKKPAKGTERRLTSQLALLLVDIEHDRQCSAAELIVQKQMNYVQARRFVLGLRRDLGLKSNPAGRARNAMRFDALATLTRRNIDAFGEYLDMPTVELLAVLESRKHGERSGLSEDLRALAKDLIDLAKRIEPEK